ncbi:CHAD domain-containing protein [Mesorhizobium sp. VNQ89]|uniref:CHAD domain-containing protein n=1 Tax=Mesorhizobium quangtriensis TaxID=3157709 RepID=UPI0032B8059D
MSYRIRSGFPLTAEVRRIAAEELNAALEWLSRVNDKPDKALHETRKLLKNVRALLRLVRSGAKDFVRKENARYREAAALLAGPRQAGALIETVDRLAKGLHDSRHRKVVTSARENLLAHRAGVLSAEANDAATQAAKACRAGIKRLGRLKLPDQPEEAADILAEGAARTLRRARRALKAARKAGEEEAFHDLRKATKAHLAHLALLREFWPSPVKTRRATVGALAEKLGELQDILVLRGLLRDGGPAVGSFAETGKFDGLCARSERRLRKACLNEAAELFRDSPKRPARRVARKARRDLAEAVPVDTVDA